MTDLSRHLPDGITWLRAAVSCIPVVGGALDHLIFDKADAIRVRNIEAALSAVKDQIGSVGEAAIDKEWFQSDEALAAFKIMSDKISYEPDPRKVEAIGRVVSACGNRTDRVEVEVPESFVTAAHNKLLERTYPASRKHFHTYIFYDPSQPDRADIDPRSGHL